MWERSNLIMAFSLIKALLTSSIVLAMDVSCNLYVKKNNHKQENQETDWKQGIHKKMQF